MARKLDEAARRFVFERARGRCEYCLIHEDSAGFRHQIDHIVSRKHGGSSDFANLALACVVCNRHKGADIAGRDRSGQMVRLFDPRRDAWENHFRIDRAVIQPLTAVGEVTARLLRLNAAEGVVERSALQSHGLYPRE